MYTCVPLRRLQWFSVNLGLLVLKALEAAACTCITEATQARYKGEETMSTFPSTQRHRQSKDIVLPALMSHR